MELCDLNLAQYIRHDSRLKNPPPEVKAMQNWNIMMQIASGVEFLHNHKEIHRDLKPGNGVSFLYSVSNEF